MSRLTSSTLASWSGVSTYGKASSSSRCQGVSGAKAWPLVACRAAYSLISSAAICRTALRARPLRLAQSEPPSRSSVGLLAADVAGHLVELVGRDEQPVGGWPRLRGGVLDHQVLAGGAGDRALDHLDVAADAVLLVHDVVAGVQLERVDLPAPPRRHPLACRVAVGALAGEVVAGEHDEVDRVGDEAVLRGCPARPSTDARPATRRQVELVDEPGGDVVVGEHLDQPLAAGRAPR